VILRRILGRASQADDTMAFDGWIVVGLGNPGPDYEWTRHNVGYLVTDELASRMGGKWKQSRSGRAVLGRPHGYMNDSGGPVSSLLRFYKADPDRLIVVHDEIDLPYGDIRVKFGGGDNGHNGLKSVRKSLGTGDYYRVRLGVGRPPGRQEPASWVLKPFPTAERRELDLHVGRAADAVESLITDGLERTQNAYNS
jgi:PTH1 family peptidyl-tRNA hydrolase